MHRVLSSTFGNSASSRRIQFHWDHIGDSGEVMTPFMQVGTYPTMNFVTLGPSISFISPTNKVNLKCCLFYHKTVFYYKWLFLVFSWKKPFSSLKRSDYIIILLRNVWRVVSEDSSFYDEFNESKKMVHDQEILDLSLFALTWMKFHENFISTRSSNSCDVDFDFIFRIRWSLSCWLSLGFTLLRLISIKS